MKGRPGRTVIAVLAVVVLGIASGALADPAPVFSTQTPMAYQVGGASFRVLLPVVNSGLAPATSVQVTSVVLSSATLLRPVLPIPLGTIQPGAGNPRGLLLTFDSSRLIAGSHYLLTVSGTYQSGGPQGFTVSRIITFGIPSIFELPANPLNVTPTLDPSHGLTKDVHAAEGRTLTTAVADGTVFTLTIPPNALLSDARISMTPVTAVGGLPVDGGLIAAVQLTPDGLRFAQPARLTIQPPVDVPLDQQVGFGYQNPGQDFYFRPLERVRTMTFSLDRLGGVGVAQGTPRTDVSNAETSLFTPAQAEVRLLNQLRELLARERVFELTNDDRFANPQYLAQLEGWHQLYFDQVLVPTLEGAATDDTAADETVEKAVSWERTVMLLGLDTTEPFATDIEFINQAIPPALENIYNRAFPRCLAEGTSAGRLVQGQRMMWAAVALDTYATLTGVTSAAAFPTLDNDLAACLRDPLRLDVNSRETGAHTTPPPLNLTQFTQSDVSAAGVTLTFQRGQRTYTGSDQLIYSSYTFRTDSVDPPDCSSGSIGHNGTVAVVARFYLWEHMARSPMDVILNVFLTPTITETSVTKLNFPPPVGCLMTASILTTFYQGDLDVIHDTTIFSRQRTSPYFLSINTSANFVLSGSLTVPPGTTVNAMEDTVMGLRLANP